MNREQYLLTKLAEEASEIAQIALKAQQFGLNETYPKQQLTNAQRIHAELNDLFTVVDLLNTESKLKYEPDEKAMTAKKAKMRKYFNLSKRLGKIK